MRLRLKSCCHRLRNGALRHCLKFVRLPAQSDCAKVVKLVDTRVLEARAARREGSSPFFRISAVIDSSCLLAALLV